MKLVIFILSNIFLFTLSSSAFCQKDNTEVEVASLSKSISGISIAIQSLRMDANADHSAEVVDLSDSLENVNKKLMEYLLAQLKSEASMLHEFKYLKDSTEIYVAESPDKKLRFFSWNTHLGGTMNQFVVVAQYKTKRNEVRTEVINSGGLLDDKNQYNALYEGVIQQAQVRNKIYYFITGSGKCETRCIRKVLTVFTIEMLDLVVGSSVLKDAKGNKHEFLEFQYDVNSIKIRWEPEFVINIRQRKIYMPLIEELTTEKKYQKFTIN